MGILIIPFIISLLSILGYYSGYSKINNILCTYLSLLYIIVCDNFLLNLITKNNYILIMGNWLGTYNLFIKWEFIFNSFTLSLCYIIISVGACIVIYSGSYMSTDTNVSKFIGYLTIFIFFMIWGILGNNLIILLIGWEGVGLMSYLLINFYDNRLEANKSGIKASLINKLGDVGLIVGILSLYIIIITIKFNDINSLIYYFKYETINIFFLNNEIYLLTLVCSSFLIGISTKSAQYLFNSWLPDAMEGPTPVSALIHSATMVGIGFLLLLKLSMLFQNSSFILYVIILIAGFTSFSTSLSALSCNDMKSINANSTSSQLSFMLLAYSNLNTNASYFHFINHAFFKATTFLISGLLIQQWRNRQDLRLINPFLIFQVPTVLVGIIITGSSLLGVPSSLGSYSKEYILEINYSQAYSFNVSNWLLMLLATSLSSSYVILVSSNLMESDYVRNHKKIRISLFNGESSSLCTAVIILNFFCLLFSDVIHNIMVTSNTFDNLFMLDNKNTLNLDYLFSNWYIKILPSIGIIIAISFFWLSLKVYSSFWTISINTDRYSSGFYFDHFINTYLIKFFWWNYFIIFRLINNKLLNPYNFIHNFIKISSIMHLITNKGGIDYEYFLFIYFLMFSSLFF